MDVVNDQFLSYQTMREENIPDSLKGNPDGGLCIVDKLCGYFKDLKKPGTNICEFRIFYKNITLTRSSLSLDGTLSSLVTVKTHIEEPL